MKAYITGTVNAQRLMQLTDTHVFDRWQGVWTTPDDSGQFFGVVWPAVNQIDMLDRLGSIPDLIVLPYVLDPSPIGSQMSPVFPAGAGVTPADTMWDATKKLASYFESAGAGSLHARALRPDRG